MCPAGKMALHHHIIKSLLSVIECGIFLIPVRHNEPVRLISMWRRDPHYTKPSEPYPQGETNNSWGMCKNCHQAVVQKINVLEKTFFKVNIITEEFLQFFKILFLFSLSLVLFSFQCEFTSFRLFCNCKILYLILWIIVMGALHQIII